MLDVAVKFEKKQATVRFEIGKVRLEQILKRYASTPFDVTPAGPVTSIVRHEQATVRAWADPGKLVRVSGEGSEQSPAASIFVEFVPAAVHRFDAPPSVAPVEKLSSLHLKLVREVAEVRAADVKPPLGPGVHRFGFAVRAEGHIEPGQVLLPVEFRYTTLNPDGRRHDGPGKVNIVLDAVADDGQASRLLGTTGVALVGGSLELSLGHLCEQKGCVDHFHKSLKPIAELIGVQPRPSLDEPRATVFIQAGQPIDVWSLREKLREQGIEVRHMVPRDLAAFECHIELPRWLDANGGNNPSQCQDCRDRTLAAVQSLAWTSEASPAGAGVTIRTRQVAPDLCTPLDKLEEHGIAPRAVWLVPAGAVMPKPATPTPVVSTRGPKTLGFESHPVIQFDFSHHNEACHAVTGKLAEKTWASRTTIADSDEQPLGAGRVLPGVTAEAAIGDRQRADLLPLLREFQAHGQRPTKIRLSDFGDLRVQFEFAHLCGDIEYSKPPKKEEKKSDEMKPVDQKSADEAKNAAATEGTNPRPAASPAEVSINQQAEAKKDEPKKEEPKKEEKPFVPQPLRPAPSSNARKAIERAMGSVSWVKDGTYLEYHTKPEFDAPRKLTLTLQQVCEGDVRLDELTRSLASAGFPPTAVRVSRLFPGIPFGHALPTDLELESAGGEKQSLASFRKPGRPLVVAFVSLYCPNWDKYKYEAEPKLFARLNQTIESFQDRVDFVAVSSNPNDKLVEVAAMLERAEIRIPVLNDSAEKARAVFNAQVTPPPHLFVFDGNGRLRYAGDPHSNWNKPSEEQRDFLGPALDSVLAGKIAANGAVSFNSPKCNCSSPNCKCPKCGCGPSCRCDIGH